MPEAVRPTLALIVAVAENGVIGDGADIPWRLPDDQRFFKLMTSGHAMVMGRVTWETFARPLPKRTSVVLTRQRGYEAEGALVAHDFDHAVALAAANPPPNGAHDGIVFVIGGPAIYEAALPVADIAYVTRVHAEFEGDVRFDAFRGDGPEGWKRVETERHEADERHAHAFTIETWRRQPRSQQ